MREKREKTEVEVTCVSSYRPCGPVRTVGQPEGSHWVTHAHTDSGPIPLGRKPDSPSPRGRSHHSRKSIRSSSIVQLLCPLPNTYSHTAPALSQHTGGSWAGTWSCARRAWREPPAPPAKVLCNVSSRPSWRAAEDPRNPLTKCSDTQQQCHISKIWSIYLLITRILKTVF